MNKPNIEQLIQGVQDWARDKGIYEHSTAEKQWMYIVAETGELADAINKEDLEAIKLEIGDVAVTIINYDFMREKIGEPIKNQILHSFRARSNSSGSIKIDMEWFLCAVADPNTVGMIDNLWSICDFYKLTLEECLAAALDKISKRTGEMKNGVFVKNEA